MLKLLGKAEPGDAARFQLEAEALRHRDCLMCIPAPVRNFSSICFERVTANSVCEPEPVRNAELRAPDCVIFGDG